MKGEGISVREKERVCEEDAVEVVEEKEPPRDRGESMGEPGSGV